MIDFIVLGVIGAMALLAWRRIRIQKEKNGGCGGCASCRVCQSQNKQEEQK